VHELVHLLERHHNDQFQLLMDQFLPSIDCFTVRQSLGGEASFGYPQIFHHYNLFDSLRNLTGKIPHSHQEKPLTRTSRPANPMQPEEKAKPAARRGRKATGLGIAETAGLPGKAIRLCFFPEDETMDSPPSFA
jgi:hypothetical protein